MENAIATGLFGCLSHGIRLDIYRLLVKAGSEGLVAGEIGHALDLPATNLSFHLKAMSQAGLLAVTQEGRFQRYRCQFEVMQALIEYLTAECCEGHPEMCLSQAQEKPVGTKASLKKSQC